MAKTPTQTQDLYALLNVDKDASAEQIKKAYRRLSLHFHTDKLPAQHRDRSNDMQETFLSLQLAHDVLLDPVLRLAYDVHGMDCVVLLKRIQQQTNEQRTRQTAGSPDRDGGGGGSSSGDHGDGDDDDDDDDGQARESLYERLERSIVASPSQARQELDRFMKQYNYQQGLADQSDIQLAVNMNFPPVVDLQDIFVHARDYLNVITQNAKGAIHPGLSPEEKQYVVAKIQQEQAIVDYQVKRIRELQKAEMGVTLSCTPPPRTVANPDGTIARKPTQWSMSMGGTANVVYPDVAVLAKMAGKEAPKKQVHPASAFCTVFYQPVPNSQIYATANLSNERSHQIVIGSARTFSNQSAFRYFLTLLSKSPLETPVMMNFKTDRHINDIGLASGGVTVGGNGQILQWQAKWAASSPGATSNHRASAKLQVGMLQGNNITLTYNWLNNLSKPSWIEEYITLPKRVELSTILSEYPKLEGQIIHEFKSMANSPTLGFGLEHDISLGVWTWIWEWTHAGSSFRIPIPVLQIGSVLDPMTYYIQKIYLGVYYMLFQAMIADILHEDEDASGDGTDDKSDKQNSTEIRKHNARSDSNLADDLSGRGKTKAEAERELKLMLPVAEKKKHLEQQSKNGLIILQATYQVGASSSPSSSSLSMDATTQLQFWVVQHKLRMPDVPKRHWMGFYDLYHEEDAARTKFSWKRLWMQTEKQVKDVAASESHQQTTGDIHANPTLTIRYRHGDSIHEVSFTETEVVSLPSEKAKVLGSSSYVI